MNEQLKKVAGRVTCALMNYRIWRIYKDRDSRMKYLEVLNKYKSFFPIGIQAHFLATIVLLHSLYETHPDGISLHCLIEALPDDKLRREVEPKLDEAKRIWHKIAILRNKVFAHLLDIDPKAMFDNAELSPKDIERLIKLSEELVNKLSYADDGNTIEFNLDPTTDTHDLLDDLLQLRSRQS